MKRWERKPCGCVKTDLERAGKVVIRCEHHYDKPSKRTIAYFDENGIVKAAVPTGGHSEDSAPRTGTVI